VWGSHRQRLPRTKLYKKTVRIGVLNDMSSLYADIGGSNSVVAIKMAVEDSGLSKKGWNIDVLSADHQTSRMSASISRGNGSPATRSTQ
jgi:branched-chain amino acid transport system substrate-binding protein